MSSSQKLDTVLGVISTNSIDYVRQIFQAYHSKKTVMLLKEQPQSDKYHGVLLSDVVVPKTDFGWLDSDISLNLSSSEEPAQISFTSGTEGRPKAIVLSHKALSDVTERLNDIMEVDDSISEYVGVPVNYSFGLGRCRATILAGGRCYIPANGFDPIEINKMLKAGEINAISAVPTLWRIILQSPELFQDTGNYVKWIEIGSQYMSQAEKELMKTIFPKANIVQHYGLTEASRTTFLEIHKYSGASLESVGKPNGQVQIRINQENNIEIHGPHVTSGILDDEGNIQPLTNHDGWFTTKDIGSIKDDLLYYGGRSDDVINYGGIKISPDHIEQLLNDALEESVNFAICKMSHDELGESILLGLEKSSEKKLPIIESHLKEILHKIGIKDSNKLPYVLLDELPRTKTGKIQRKKIADQYQPEPLQTKGIEDKGPIYQLFSEEFKTIDILPGDTFTTLGGGSLNYVKMSIKLEKHLGELPEEWQSKAISDLSTLAEKAGDEKKPIQSNVETNIFLRALATISIVSSHSGFIFGAGTAMLFLLSGFGLSRFQSEQMLKGNVWLSIYRQFKGIFVPFTVLVLLYFTWKQKFFLPTLLFSGNLFPFDMRAPTIFPTWFVEVLFQSLIIIGIIFSVKAFRNIYLRNRWATSFSLMIIFIIIRLIFPTIYDTHYLYQRVPPIYLGLIWLGWCIYISTTDKQKIWVLLAALAYTLAHQEFKMGIWILCGSLLLVFTKKIMIPAFAKGITNVIASSAFFIYLLHMIFIHIPENVLNLNSSIANILFGLLGPIIVWWFVEKVRNRKERFLHRISRQH